MSEDMSAAEVAVDDDAPAFDEGAARTMLRGAVRAAAFGEIMSVLIQSPRHRNVTMGALASQMMPAFRCDQFLVAKAKRANSDDPAAPIGVAFWGCVSEEVDRRLSAQPETPIELAEGEWQSGDIVWLIDVVAPPKVSAALMKSIRERLGPEVQVKLRTTDADGNARVAIIK